MEEVQQFLCPHVPMDKIVVRAEVLKEQLQRVLPDVCVEKEITPRMMCSICNNTDDRSMITDYSQGLLICLGTDGVGCGGVVTENIPVYSTQRDNDFIDPYELFSSQAEFTSDWLTSTHQHGKRMNKLIEKNLHKYTEEHTVTSNTYKDTQRKDVYDLIDKLGENTNIGLDAVHALKLVFHEYRTRMNRIHKVEVAVAALYYLLITP